MDKMAYKSFKDSASKSLIRLLPQSAHYVVLADVHIIFKKQYKI